MRMRSSAKEVYRVYKVRKVHNVYKVLKLITCVLFLILIRSVNCIFAQTPTETIRNLVAVKNYTEAAKYIPAAIRDNPKDDRFMLLCGDIYTELDKPDSALIMYRKADDIKGRQTLTWRKIGKTLSLMNKTPFNS